jgi:hypothetical protein
MESEAVDEGSSLMAGDFVAVPDWFAWENQDCGLAVADIDGDGRPDVVVLMVDNPVGQNSGLYRVGRSLAADGTIESWGPWIAVPDWWGWENQGAGIAVADLDGTGRQDLVVFVVDNPAEQNQGYYRIGRGVAPDGTVTGGWTPWIAVPDWYGWENQGADIAVAQIGGQTTLVVLTVDNPGGQNTGQFRLGAGLRSDGTVMSWTPWVSVPDWWGWENQGAGVAVTDLDGDGRPELIVFTIDNPAGENAGKYTIGWGIEPSGHAVDGWGLWSTVPGWGFWENQGAARCCTPVTCCSSPAPAMIPTSTMPTSSGPASGIIRGRASTRRTHRSTCSARVTRFSLTAGCWRPAGPTATTRSTV